MAWAGEFKDQHYDDSFDKYKAEQFNQASKLNGVKFWIKDDACIQIKENINSGKSYSSKDPFEVQILETIAKDSKLYSLGKIYYKVKILKDNLDGYVPEFDIGLNKIKEPKDVYVLNGEIMDCFLTENPKAVYEYLAKEDQRKKLEEDAQWKKPMPRIGMTKGQVRGSTRYGEPHRVNTTQTAKNTREQWIYEWTDGSTYIYFENGKVVAIQEF